MLGRGAVLTRNEHGSLKRKQSGLTPGVLFTIQVYIPHLFKIQWPVQSLYKY